MYSLLLKKALPFALTFIIGSLIGGLFNFFFGTGGYTPMPTRPYFYSYGEGHGHSCRMRARGRYLVAETKQLVITFKPNAFIQSSESALGDISPVLVTVTFGADGKVQDVAPAEDWSAGERTLNERQTKQVWEAVERAARNIQFEPEMVNGLPVTVTREVKIQPLRCGSEILDYSIPYKR